MKPCTLCGEVKPDESFPANKRTRTQLDSWCVDCYRIKKAEWKRVSRGNTRAWKEEERGKLADPIQWAGLHCRHISDYVTKIVTRFESKTGKEAPPQLLAIRQLADQSASALPERTKTERPGHIACRNCGREFFPSSRNWWHQAYCSSYCRERMKQIVEVFESTGQGADK